MRETHPTLRAARGDPLWASRNPSLFAGHRFFDSSLESCRFRAVFAMPNGCFGSEAEIQTETLPQSTG